MRYKVTIGSDGFISVIWTVNEINAKLTQVNMFPNEVISLTYTATSHV